jgi:hypothetical protein
VNSLGQRTARCYVGPMTRLPTSRLAGSLRRLLSTCLVERPSQPVGAVTGLPRNRGSRSSETLAAAPP